ncbi:MAG: DNA repair protein RadC [Clostridia bacterium]|nr:DNA repair protein RadC [Clostridia bacterium]
MEENRFTMRSLPEEIRPYERAEALGEERLSDAELLAVLLRSGTKESTALEIAQTLLKKFGGLRGIGAASREKLSEIKGVGRVKAIVLRSAFELSKRGSREKRVEKVQIRSVQNIADLYMAEMKAANEQVRVVLLDVRSRIIRDEIVSVGSSNKAMVDPKDIFTAAIDGRAASIVLMHNHPTGDCSPSKDDFEFTEKMVRAGRLLGIRVVDHLIFGDNTYYSFFESGDMVKISGRAERAG